jgi:signal transduction histidine kinase
MKSDIEQAIKSDDNNEIKKVAYSILDEIQRLQDITDKLTQLALIESEELELETKTTWLNDILFNEINRVKNATLQKGLVINTSKINSVACNGEKKWLNILFRNIIDNAIKYSYDNSNIDIYVRLVNDFANVSIRDYGTGVSENELVLLTNRFFRSNQIESSTTGSGLGLSICNWIVKKHKGTIKFKSHRPGLEVVIKLPIK